MDGQIVSFEEFQATKEKATQHSEGSFSFTDGNGNTQNVALNDKDFGVDLDKIVKDLDSNTKPFTDKTLNTVVDNAKNVGKTICGTITDIGNASKELVRDVYKHRKAIILAYMVFIGAASAAKSDIMPEEESFGNHMIKEYSDLTNYIPVVNDVTDYVAGSINRAVSYYKESKNVAEISFDFSDDSTSKDESVTILNEQMQVQQLQNANDYNYENIQSLDSGRSK